MHFPEMRISNCVWEIDFNMKVDLQRFADRFNIVYYSPIVFSAATVYFDEDPKISLLLFSNGKVIGAGVKSRNDLQTACKNLAAMLETTVPSEECFTLRNIVATLKWGKPLDLNKIYGTLKKQSTVIHHFSKRKRFNFLSELNYTPELFPGMKVVIGPERATAIVFRSGKIIITGATTWDDLDDAYDRIRDVIASVVE